MKLSVNGKGRVVDVGERWERWKRVGWREKSLYGRKG